MSAQGERQMKFAFSIALLISVFAGVSAAQRTVTNEDLEQYRQKRLMAEQDYRLNHEKMGFPSPEELQRQLDQKRTETFALAERLRQERLEVERVAIERERVGVEWENLAIERRAAEAANAPPATTVYDGYYGLGYPNYLQFRIGRPYRGYRGYRGQRFGGEWQNFGNGIPRPNYYGSPGLPGRTFGTGRW